MAVLATSDVPYVLVTSYVNEIFQKSGLSQWIGNQLTVFSSLDPSITSLLLSLLVAAVTEVTTNIATVTLFLPILGNLVSY